MIATLRSVGAVLLSAAALLGWMNRHPLVFREASPAPASGARPARTARAPFAVLVAPPEASRPSGDALRFSRIDWSLAWLDVLERELGPVGLQAPDAGGPPSGAGLVVVGAGACEAAARAGLGRWRAFVEAGGVLVLELPGPEWAPLSGAWCAGEGAFVERLSDVDPAVLPAWALDALRPWPLLTRVRALNVADGGTEALVRGTAGVLLARRRVGEGGVLALGYDWGRLLVAWRQGAPGEDLLHRVNPAKGTGFDFLQTTDLVHPALPLESFVPFADAWWDLLLAAVEDLRPLARWWPHPGGAAGSFLVTYDDENQGDASRTLTRYAAERRAPVTLFSIPELVTAEGLRAMTREGAEIALHWQRGFYGRFLQRFGWGRLRPVARELGLVGQTRVLREKAGAEARVVANRNHGLLWDAEFGATLGTLAAAGFRVDSSYGPAGPRAFGYVFGTGLPFRALDRRGLPLGVHEHPFLAQDDERLSRALLGRLLEESRARWHQALNVIFHSEVMTRRPSAETFETWLECFDLARRHGHALVTVGALQEHRDACERSPLALVEGRIEAAPAAPGLWLRLPERLAAHLPDGASLPRIETLGRTYVLAPAGAKAGPP